MPTLLDHDLADEAPQGPLVTWYDRDHVITYVRLLDAEKESADWRDASRIVLHVDPDREPDRARLAYDTHLSRAKWMMRSGYRFLLRTAE
jgi:hypothetical protein